MTPLDDLMQPVRAGHHVLADALPAPLRRPLTCRWPENGPPAGIVVFCHGLGSNGTEYAALSRHWAEHGYLVIHPTFADAIALVAEAEPDLGLDPRADLSRWTARPDLRQHMHRILHASASWLDRLAVVDAVMAALPRILAETCGPLPAPLPMAIAGHSFGAFTAQLLAGAVIDLPGDPGRSFADPRFAAAILLSAQGRDQQGLRDGSWDAMRRPVLTVTGTLDRGANGGGAEWKSEPFARASAPDQYLAVLEDGDHFLGGFTRTGAQRQVPAQAEAVKLLTLTFLDAHLRADPAAGARLRATGDRIGAAPLLFRAR